MADDAFLFAHTAALMDARLEFVKRVPETILLIGEDCGHSHALLRHRYPKARFMVVEDNAERLAAAQARRNEGKSFRRLWRQGKIELFRQPVGAPLPTAVADMAWANLSLIGQPGLPEVFTHLSKALKRDGMLFFSHVGVDTAKELRALLSAHGINPPAEPFADMHDLGDMLLQHGFYDPVMDVEINQFSYSGASRLLADLALIGLDAPLGLSGTPRATLTVLIDEALRSGSLKSLTIEWVFGHALQKPRLPASISEITFYPKP